MKVLKFFTILYLFFNVLHIFSVTLDFRVGPHILKGDNRALVTIEYNSAKTRTFTIGPHEEIDILKKEENISDLPKFVAIQFDVRENGEKIPYGILFKVKPNHFYSLSTDDPMICNSNEVEVEKIGDRKLLCLKETNIQLPKHKHHIDDPKQRIITIELTKNMN